ncbi:hypothetical protein GCM10020216_082270 [Nonomuraea helvata]
MLTGPLQGVYNPSGHGAALFAFARKLVIPTGKNKGWHPSVASVWRGAALPAASALARRLPGPRRWTASHGRGNRHLPGHHPARQAGGPRHPSVGLRRPHRPPGR